MLRLGLCQISPGLFNVQKNFEQIILGIEKCTQQKSDLIVFPELSLTGFNLGSRAMEMVEEISNQGVLDRLIEITGDAGIDLVIGLPLAEGDKIYNSSIYLSKGVVLGTHRKIYLADYGHCQEHKYFQSGEKITCIDTEFGRVAILISEDAWHVSTFLLAVQMGAKIIIICSATSVVDRQKLYEVQFAWETINNAIAFSQTVYVVYANRSGEEDELVFWGGSHVTGFDGQQLSKAKIFAEDYIFADLDLGVLEKVRKEFPLVSKEKNFLTRDHFKYLK